MISAGLRAVRMQPTPIFGEIPADFSPDRMSAVFPVSTGALADGIERYRAHKGYETATAYEGFEVTERLLPNQVFTADGRTWRIVDARVEPIAHPILRESVGDVEMSPHLLVPSIAAAVGALDYIGKGIGSDAKNHKKAGDRAATEAMRAAFNMIPMAGVIRGGEGGGRDGMTRLGALVMNELVGTGAGQKINFYVDPLEVTNGTYALQKQGGWGKVGKGWSEEMSDPANWYPGYSGSTSLMLAINANKGRARPLSDFLYLNKLQFNYRVWETLRSRGFSIENDPKDLVDGVAAAFKIPASDLRAAALARARHMKTMRGWLDAGMKPWNISNPSDGDAMFAAALASGALHFAGLTGGVMEGVISAALGIPMGITTLFQFVSHDRLGEHKEEADLTDPRHRFGFSLVERMQMRLTRLFDGQHIGNTVRAGDSTDDLATHLINAIFRKMPLDAYDAFIKRFNALASHDEPFTPEEQQALIEAIQRFAPEQLTERHVKMLCEQVRAGRRNGVRFTDEERAVMIEVLKREGYLDVRDQHTFGSFITGTRDYLAAVSAITHNKWAPLQAIQQGSDGTLVVNTLVATGAHAVYRVSSTIVENPNVRLIR